MFLYKLVEISYGGRNRYIVCQAKNGPACPLIAVANFLILSRGANIRPNSNGYVSQQHLFNLVTIYLNLELGRKFKHDKVKISEVKAELLAALPNFANGLFINPHFNSMSHFDKTPELSLMECLGIPLLHSWIDNEDSKTASVLDLIDLDIPRKSMESIQKENSAECTASLTTKVEVVRNNTNEDAQESSHDIAARVLDLFDPDIFHKLMESIQKESSAECTASLTSEVEVVRNTTDEDAQESSHDIRSKLIKDSTENMKAQLTSYGVSCLCDHMLQEKQELAVLYRNGHFLLIHVHEDTLHTLQTDLDLRTIHPNAQWQILDDVHGDNFFVTGNFRPIKDEDEDKVRALYLQNRYQCRIRRYERASEKPLENLAKKAAEASKHEDELLKILEKEKLNKERKAKKKAKHKLRCKANQVDGTPEATSLQKQQNIVVITDSAHETIPPQQEQDVEVIQDVTPGVSPLQHEQNTVVIPDSAPETIPPQQEQNIEVTQDGTTGAAPLQQDQKAEVIPDSTAAATAHQEEENTVILSYDTKWVAGRFLKFLTDFNYYGKSATPYFEAEIKAMKIRNLYEMSIHYNDIHHDCEELAIVIRDHYDSVLEDLRGSLVKYLVAHAVEVKMAEEAVLKIHGRPISYRSFVDFAEENRSALTEFHEIYMKTVAKCTSELGRRMARGYLRYIIDMHKKGLCWQGDWKDSDMKVRSDGREFTITKVPEYNISKDGMKEDFKKFFEILFPYYMHESEETNSVSGKIEKKKVLPYYFLQFQQDCAEVPHPQRESVKFENFQKFLGSHPAFMSPLAMTTFIGDLFISCDNLRHHNAEFLPLQDKTAKMVDWIDHAKNLCKPFRDIYYLVTSAAYEPGYWYFLNFLRNFIQHMRMDKPDQDIAVSGIMIGYHLEIYVPPFILFVLNNCDMNSLFLSSSWNRFEESQ